MHEGSIRTRLLQDSASTNYSYTKFSLCTAFGLQTHLGLLFVKQKVLRAEGSNLRQFTEVPPFKNINRAES